ncbi:MAG: tyrosine-protein phosphatase [Scrofimicrobium sp.]
MTIKYDLTGFYNFREGGGMAAGDARVRTQRLLRSDFPQSFDAEDIEFMQEVPLATVLDLRTDTEIDSQPQYFKNAGFNVVEVPILSGSIKSMMENIPTVSQLYQSMIAQSPKQLAQSVATIAGAVSKGAALVHCTAGKDRTGVVIAMTQELLGVSDEDIVANYVQTQDNLQGAWLAKMQANMQQMMSKVPDLGKIDVAAVTALATGSPAEAIQGVLDTIRKEHGTVKEFVLSNGVSEEEIDILRSELLVK